MHYPSTHPYAAIPSNEDLADTEQAVKMVKAMRKAAEIEDKMVELESLLHTAGYKPWSEAVWASAKKIQEIGEALNNELNSSYEHVRDEAENQA